MHNQAKFSHIWPGWAIHMGQEIATTVALFAMPKCEEEMHPLQSRLMSISNLEKWKHWFKQTQKRLTKPFPFRRGVGLLTVSRCSSFREGDHCWNPATVGTSGPWNYDFSSENGWKWMVGRLVSDSIAFWLFSRGHVSFGKGRSCVPLFAAVFFL